MRLSSTMLVLAIAAWPAASFGEGGLRGGAPKDQAAEKKTTPSGPWSGTCADGGPDWGDPMQVAMSFHSEDDTLVADFTIDFEGENKEKRKAKATLKGKRVSGEFQLTGTMKDVKDDTQWEIRLDTRLEGTRLSGRFLEVDNNNHLMCTFSWTKK